ncbi:lipocalin-like domain-containing protein [Streptomyces fagopyri]|uniref:lipocalin-like domain-containing protein n=1 Tax=Streptomyces fagopyri TaxID=2662397 RepID=UPI0036BF073A
MGEPVNNGITAQTLLGTWLLGNVTEVDENGQAREDAYGSGAMGMIMYSPDGYMSAVVRGERDARPVTVAYSGTYSLDNGVLRHHVCVGIPPFDSDQTRHPELLAPDTLKLSTGERGRARTEITWRRARGGAARADGRTQRGSQE